MAALATTRLRLLARGAAVAAAFVHTVPAEDDVLALDICSNLLMRLLGVVETAAVAAEFAESATELPFDSNMALIDLTDASVVDEGVWLSRQFDDDVVVDDVVGALFDVAVVES